MLIEYITSSVWTMLAVAYSVGFWAVFLWVYLDARGRGRARPLLNALGIAAVFPIGIFIYLGTRDWD